MNRHRDVGSRRGDPRAAPTPLPELARTLRRARTRQGLRLEDVSARTGLPLEQLQVLETGTVERIPDRVAILRTLRRYADHLGLPGDRFVLAMVDQWPTTIDRATSVVAVGPLTAAPAVPPQVQPVHTGPVPAQPLDTDAVPVTSMTAPVAPVAPRPVAAPPSLAPPIASSSATGQGGPIPQRTRPNGATTGTRQLAATAPADTGVVPAYQPQAATRMATRRPRTPLGLRILVVFAALAVIVGVGGLLVHHYEPRWLRDLGITHGPRSAAHDNTGSSTTGQTASQPSFAVAAATPTGATLDVRSLSFTVVVTSVGGSSWIQTTAAGQAAPTFAGVLTAGQTHTVSVQRSLAMTVGSVAAHISVSVDGKTVGTYVPTAAPSTITFQSVP